MTDIGRIVLDKRKIAHLQREGSGEGERLGEFLLDEIAGEGKSITDLENELGLAHYSLKRTIQGHHDSLKIMIEALDLLGFDVVLRRRDV